METSTTKGSRTEREQDREDLRDKTSREDRMERRKELRCSYCPPHGGENASYKKHGSKKKRKKGRVK